jgi:hypothetical protein
MTAAKKSATNKKAAAMTDKKAEIIAYKGFNRDWTCTPRGVKFQYELGKTYEHTGPVTRCGEGFHACEHPLNVFDYYPPATSRFAEVTLSGDVAREYGGDTKIAAAKITINVELSIGDLVKRAWDYVWSRAKIEDGGHATGDRGAASATGYQGAASATGDRGAASATGHRGAASATGDRGAASATGYRGAAMACGYEGRAMGKEGNAIFLAERDSDLNIIAVWAGIVGRDGIKPETWYTLRDGKPVEVA